MDDVNNVNAGNADNVDVASADVDSADVDSALYSILLFDYYGMLLNERRRAIYSAFYLEDLSFTEIALEKGVTRQAINSSLRESKKKLAYFEQKLGLVKARGKVDEAKFKVLEIVGQEHEAAVEEIFSELL